MHRLVGVGAEVLGGLADEETRHEAAQHRAEQPDGLRVDGLVVPHDEDHEDGDDLDDGGEVRAAVEGLVQLGAFLRAHGQQADDRGDDAAAGDEHRDDDGPRGVDAAERAEVAERGERRGQDGGRQDGAGVGLEQVGAHARDVAHVVAHVVGDGGRVARIVLRNARFDLAHEVGAHVGRLRVDAAAHTGEQRDSRCAGGEALDHAHMLVHEVERVDAEHEQDEPEAQAQQRERSNGQAHGEARLEADVQRGGHGLLGGVGGARIGARGHVHADVAGERRQDAAGHERDGRDRGQRHRHHHGHHDHEDDEQLVLAHEERLRALLNLQRNVVHFVRTRVLLEHP